MKFGSKYRVFIASDLPPSYGRRCVVYKDLKKKLGICHRCDSPFPRLACTQFESPFEWAVKKLRHKNDLAKDKAKKNCRCCETHFFPELELSIKVASSYFRERALFLLQAHQAKDKTVTVSIRGVKKRRLPWFHSRVRTFTPAETKEINVTTAELAREARYLCEFAQANSTALRKLMKKYDKLHKSKRGGLFIEHLQASPEKCMFIRSSPLLHEVCALRANLELEAPGGCQSASSLVVCGDLGSKGPARGCACQEEKLCLPAPSGLDLECPVCLDLMDDPVALRCGHAFCRRCACMAAGVPSGNLADAPLLSKCPVCRTIGAFDPATLLPEVAAYARTRCAELQNTEQSGMEPEGAFGDPVPMQS